MQFFEQAGDLERLRGERDGFKNAYHTTAEELGEARILLKRYQGLLDAASEDKSRPAAPLHGHMPENVGAFLIIGNGRSGSTWLLTSADRFPDTMARREINWRYPGLPSHRTQVHIDGSTASMRQAIATANDITGSPRRNGVPITVAGGKLIYDLHGFLGPEAFDHIERITEPGTKLVALRRSYMEWWLSWKARSIYHELNVEVLKKTNPTTWERELALAADARPMKRELVLTIGGKPLADPAAMDNPIHYPLRNAIDDMLMGFYNDIMSARIARDRGGMILDYEEIGPRLPEFAAFIGSTVPLQAIEEIRSAPVTNKLELLPHSMVGPSDILPELSALLVSLRSRADVWTWHSRNAAEIRSPELVAFLRRFGIDATGASSGIQPTTDPNLVLWRVRKPIYSV